MAEANHAILRDGLEGHANEGEEVGDGDGPAFLLTAGALLDQSVDRDHEEAARDPEKSEMHQRGEIRDARSPEQSSYDQDASQARQNHAQLNPLAGEKAGEEAANSDAEAERGKEIA